MPAPKKFLLIASYADSLVGFRGALIDALLQAGCEVHVAAPCLNAATDITDRLTSQGVQCHDIPLGRTGMNPVQDVRTLFGLVRLMRRVRPDYVMGYTVKPVAYGSIAAWMAGVPRRFALITGLGRAFQSEMDGSGLQRLVCSLYRFALGRTNLVFFQNPDDEALFRSLRILPGRVPSCVVSGSGVNTAQFDVEPLPSFPCRFLMIARLLGDKGVREYVQAARIVRERHPEVQCALVGWLDDSPSAISRAELDEWVENGDVDYLGRLSDVRPAIAGSHAYVLPSYREGTPRTVLEAMAMGRAIITTDAPGCRETVEEGQNGYLVPVQDADALAQAMIKCVEQPEIVAAMGRRSREIAEGKYDVHKVNAAMLRGMDIGGDWVPLVT